MQYRGLRAFCVAAEKRSFKDAAETLCLTASAVSHQIRDLEDYLGTRLFIRHTRAIELSPAGHQFLAAVEPHMRAIDGAAQALRGEHAQTRLLIEMPAFFASEMFLPEMDRFAKAHRHIDLHIETTNPHEPRNPQADINIELSRHSPDTKAATALFPIRYQPACSPAFKARWQGRQGSLLGRLDEATVLVHRARPNAWAQWQEQQSSAGAQPPLIQPRQIISVDSMYALARAAEQGVGIALIPMPVSQQWFDRGALVPLGNAVLHSDDHYWMTRNPQGADLSATELLCDWIVNRFAATDDVFSSVA
ncbi:MAG: LysR family transcriptional regulator [Pseudomonadota bacterium]